MERIFQILRCWTRELRQQDHQEFLETQDRFLRGRQIAFRIYEYFRVTGAHDTVLDYADLLTLTLSNDDVQEFDTRWDEYLLSMSKVPTDDVLESLYKLQIRESDQFNTVLDLYELEIHHNIWKTFNNVERTRVQQMSLFSVT